METKWYHILKTGMTVLLLAAAYFLPGVCIRKIALVEQENRNQQTMAEAEAETKAAAGKEKNGGTIVLDSGHGGCQMRKNF